MKTVVVVYEAAADRPLAELQGRTPLQVARCPYATALAEAGATGMVVPALEGVPLRPESFLAMLLGAPASAAQALQPGPAEATGILDPGSHCRYAFCGRLVTWADERVVDWVPRGLSLEETRGLAATLADPPLLHDLELRITAPGRLVTLLRQWPPDGEPASGRAWTLEDFPAWLLAASHARLTSHPINEVRLDLKENPANAVALWGGGALPAAVDAFLLRREGARGVMVTNSLMARGLARMFGMHDLPLALADTAPRAGPAFKLAPVMDALQSSDVCVVYMAAPGGNGDYGPPVEKIRLLEAWDAHVLGPLLSILQAVGGYRILLVSDGMVARGDRQPLAAPVPFVFYDEAMAEDDVRHWDEQTCLRGALGEGEIARLAGLIRNGN